MSQSSLPATAMLLPPLPPYYSERAQQPMRRYTQWLRRRGPLFLLLWLLGTSLVAQPVYKTPTGKKFHRASCRMVENVSAQLVDASDVAAHQLDACKICNPAAPSQVQSFVSEPNKAVGEGARAQCKGTTQAGLRCQHITQLANGYCYQHTSQQTTPRLYQPPAKTTSSSTCGARTQSGGYCKRPVKGGGRCYQH